MLNIFFAPGATGLMFWRLIEGSGTTYMRSRYGADARFSVLQKRQKIAEMTPNDLLILKIVSSKPLGNTEHYTL